MNHYIEQLKTYFSEVEDREGFGGIPSILEFLWNCYSCEHPVYDGKIHEAEKALAPVLEELSVEASDAVFDLVVHLCDCYQRAAFLEGIQVGARLVMELSK